MNTHKQILAFLQTAGRPVTPHELADTLQKSRVSIQKVLKHMLSLGIIEKIGSSPRVYYRLVKDAVDTVSKNENSKQTIVVPSTGEAAYINKEFVVITPSGNERAGFAGFLAWCHDRNMDPQKMETEYVDTHRSYMKLKTEGRIDASSKLDSTFREKKLDHLFFLYPHSIPVFGKTKIATWLFHGKQVQDKKRIDRVLEVVVPEILSVIHSGAYNAIAFVPPTVPRSLQFMTELQKRFVGRSIIIPIEKIFTDIRIQQKSLRDVADRIHNAENTFVVPLHDTHYDKVLIIDDFTGSGATLHVLAGMFKKQHIASVVDGLTITGSMNGFEVIKEL